MRKLKFRAYDKLNNEFIENFEEKYLIEVLNIDLHNVMQFTGLQDKNGIDIYEGDLLEFYGGNQLAVFFEYGSFGCTDYNNNFLSFCSWNMRVCEVVGNIYENKI